MTYVPGLAVALAVFWFAMSGETSPFFLGLSVIAVLATLWISASLKIIDRDSSPYHRAPHLLIYMGWLIIEIVKANLAVIARVLGVRHSIDPAMVEVTTSTRTSLGKALFANSITLTPGTVTVDVEGQVLKVHALVRENAGEDSFTTMDRGSSRAADTRDKGRG
jgi:multicomponent Na+:H+ antiporter subunit E